MGGHGMGVAWGMVPGDLVWGHTAQYGVGGMLQ